MDFIQCSTHCEWRLMSLLLMVELGTVPGSAVTLQHEIRPVESYSRSRETIFAWRYHNLVLYTSRARRWEGGVSPHYLTGHLGEHRKLPHWSPNGVPDTAPAEGDFKHIWSQKESIWNTFKYFWLMAGPRNKHRRARKNFPLSSHLDGPVWNCGSVSLKLLLCYTNQEYM